MPDMWLWIVMFALVVLTYIFAYTDEIVQIIRTWRGKD